MALGHTSRKESSSIRILSLRGEYVALDGDLSAVLMASPRILRVPIRHTPRKSAYRYAFELTPHEFDALRDHPDFSDHRALARAPWAFTERGVILTASSLGTDQARAGIEMAVEAFIKAQKASETGEVMPTSFVGPYDGPVRTPHLQNAIERVLSSLMEPEVSQAVKKETEALLLSATAHLKARLAHAGLENEKTAAEISKILAQVETEKAASAKAHAEAERERLGVLKEKLALIGMLSRYLDHGDETFMTQLLQDH